MARSRSNTRQSKSWIGVTVNDIDVSSVTQVLLGSVVHSEGTGFTSTVLRTRGQLLLMGDPTAVTDTDVIGLGLIVVQENARIAGGVSLPGPIKDIGADWFWHQLVSMDGAGSVSELGPWGAQTRLIEIDSKAMRRWPEDSDVVLVAEALSGDFASIQATGGIRLLHGH